MVSTVRVFDEIVCDEIISAGSTFSRPGIECNSSAVIPLSLLLSLANCGGGGGVYDVDDGFDLGYNPNKNR
ncbi:hypothetical protein BLA29_014176 [Euroglyphus maynei]|uniref:Uncharacterized protein n=1 Tax=Euroglyphus maynei TaxID=6958 RepID=A0A1Y3AWV7_EURMA|nr:hypothetical protein BLA29_014176 [Euroglyphus maynei]